MTVFATERAFLATFFAAFSADFLRAGSFLRSVAARFLTFFAVRDAVRAALDAFLPTDLAALAAFLRTVGFFFVVAFLTASPAALAVLPTALAASDALAFTFFACFARVFFACSRFLARRAFSRSSAFSFAAFAFARSRSIFFFASALAAAAAFSAFSFAALVRARSRSSFFF